MTICYTEPVAGIVAIALSIVSSIFIYLYPVRKRFQKSLSRNVIGIILGLFTLGVLFFVFELIAAIFFTVCGGIGF